MDNNKAILKSKSPYSATMTREQFLFHEVRTTAKLLHEGCSTEELMEHIVSSLHTSKSVLLHQMVE